MYWLAWNTNTHTEEFTDSRCVCASEGVLSLTMSIVSIFDFIWYALGLLGVISLSQRTLYFWLLCSSLGTHHCLYWQGLGLPTGHQVYYQARWTRSTFYVAIQQSCRHIIATITLEMQGQWCCSYTNCFFHKQFHCSATAYEIPCTCAKVCIGESSLSTRNTSQGLYRQVSHSHACWIATSKNIRS